MLGWAPNTRIRILLSSEVEDLRPQAETAAAQLAEMTGGVLTAFVESGGDNIHIPAPQGPVNTVKVVSTRQTAFPTCDGGTFGCARADPDKEPVRTRVVLWMGPDVPAANRRTTFLHELGHALMGFGHWSGWFGVPALNGLPVSCAPLTPPLQYPFMVMCGMQESSPLAQRDDFSPLEVEAARRVYAAGLRPGAPRSSLVSAGLIQ
jgi:hypothetical protein